MNLNQNSPAWKRIARLLDPVIFYSLLVLIAVTAIPYGAVEPWWKAIFECAVFTLGVLWTIDCLLSRTWRIGGRGLLLPVLALIAFALLQTVPVGTFYDGGIEGGIRRTLSSDPYETRLFVFQLLALTVTGVLLLRYTSSQRRLRILISVVVGVGVGSALFGLVRQWAQHENGFFLPHLRLGLGYAQFINRNHFAFLMEMALGLVLGLAVGRGMRSKGLILYLLAAFLMWLAIILSGSRGGLAAMLVQVLFLATMFSVVRPERDSGEGISTGHGKLWRAFHALAVRVLLIVCLMISMAVGIVWVGGDPLVSRLESAQVELGGEASDKYTNTSRQKMWHATWLLIEDHPFTGVGFGGYWAVIPRYHAASGGFTPQQAHNDYLELLASGGLVGISLVAWLVFSFVLVVLKHIRTTDPFGRAACLGALAGIFAVAFHSSIDFGLHMPINALIFTVLIVIAIQPLSALRKHAPDQKIVSS